MLLKTCIKLYLLATHDSNQHKHGIIQMTKRKIHTSAMEDLSDCSTEVIEFPPYNQGKVLTELADISIATDPLPMLLDKSVETNKKCTAETQTQSLTSSGVNIDENKLGHWLKKIYPFVEAELVKGPTPISLNRILNSNEDEEELTIQTYQRIVIPSKESYQGLATWLSIYTNNTPVLVLTTFATHDDWCEHVDQNIKVYIPKRMQSSSFAVFEELKSIPTKSCLGTLSTNQYDKDLFAGGTVSGDLYIWKFISNKNQGDIKELFCETLDHGSVIAFDWPSANRMLTCHANGWVSLWLIGNHLFKEVKNRKHTLLELTTMVSVSLTDFIVGCTDGSLHYCSNSNMGALKTGIEITQMKRHTFAVTNLIKKDIAGRRLIISCDLSGEVFFHDLVTSDEDGPTIILRIPLPFQNNIVCSKDGKIIFCPGIDGSLEVYRVSNGKRTSVNGVLQGKGNMIKLSDNGSWIVTGLYGGNFQIFSIRN